MSISDINDNSPKFAQSRTHILIPEDASPGEAFQLPVATDADSPSNGVVDYRFLSASMHFRLDKRMNLTEPEIWLVLTRELDRESRDRFDLVIAAYDGGSPRRSSTLGIAVEVGDVNDNSPKFTKTNYDVSVPEDTPIGTTITRLHARDADIGPNGHVRYSLSQKSQSIFGNVFAIDPETGDVVLLQNFDYSSQNVYHLGVIAEDQAAFPIPAMAALVVTVVDVNDHAPRISVDFLSDSGTMDILENADVGTFVAHVSVTDSDAGDSGLVHCSVDSMDFKLTPIYVGEYKIVTTTVFDRERKAKYEVLIRFVYI